MSIARLPAEMSQRVEMAEWLDQGLGSEADVAANLAEMWRINRYLGGTRALSRHLYPRLARAARAEGQAILLDLGTGSADGPLAAVRWARSRGLCVRALAVDWARRNLLVARQRLRGAEGVQLVQADAGRLPLGRECVSLASSSLFIHHLAPAQVIEVLRSAYARSRHGIVMSDLMRGWLPYLGFKLVQPVFARHPITRYDGAVSIRRAYTPGEWLDLARQAGLPHARVYTHWPWRMTLVADKPGDAE